MPNLILQHWKKPMQMWLRLTGEGDEDENDVNMIDIIK